MVYSNCDWSWDIQRVPRHCAWLELRAQCTGTEGETQARGSKEEIGRKWGR